MKHTILKISLLLLLAVCFTACKKSEVISGFQADPKLLLSIPADLNNGELLTVVDDSAHCRFAYATLDVREATVILNVQVVGDQTDYDRTFNIEIDPAQSTALSDEYLLDDRFILPAGESAVNVPLILRRTDRLAETEAHITLRLIPTADFQVESQKLQIDGERTHFKIYWSDILTRPTWWTTTYFQGVGKYSRVKHRFMMDVLAMTPVQFELLPSDIFSFIQLRSGNIFKNYLDVYNQNHPDNLLQSEFGEEIGFCATCN